MSTPKRLAPACIWRSTRDLASLRGKRADVRRHFAEDQAKALEEVEALSKVKTPSQFSSKGRDLERH